MNDALKATFKPEFLNRLDEIIVFNKLSPENIERIARLMLAELRKRVAALGITLDFSDGAVKHLASVGYDQIYGARPLRRAIVRAVEDKFSEELLSGAVKEGDTVTAELDGTNIKFIKK